MLSLPLFLFEDSMLNNGGAKNDWVSGFFVLLQNLRRFAVPVAVRIVDFPLVVLPSLV